MLEKILHESRVQKATHGLSLATLRSGEIASTYAVGIRGAHDRAAVDSRTVFEAASLTKPVVSFIALQLAEEGLLDLDRPLHLICGSFVADDERAKAITALHVLTHSSGLPNIAGAGTPLKTYFAPGERFNYGSSAFGWLQQAIERLTDSPLEELARTRVFKAFGMADSSLNWQDRFESNHAQGQELNGQAVSKRRAVKAAASWSLLTTATDYAHFVRAVLRGTGLSSTMHTRWFTPMIAAREGVDDVLNSDAAEEKDVAWGLGWGLEPSQGCFFHWGHNPGFRAFVMGNLETKDAVVWFANSASGLRLARHVLPEVLPGRHRSLDWLQIGKTFDE
jgi:CubicO group peptidase (beta-lactamase class C family)